MQSGSVFGIAVGEIKYEHLFVDGTKIEANSNKYSFVWKKSTNKYESQVLSKLEELMVKLCRQYDIIAAPEPRAIEKPTA